LHPAPGDRRTKARRRLMLVAKLGLVALLIWAMVHFGWLDLGKLKGAASRPLHLALAAGLMLAALLLTIVRWRTLLAVQGVRPAPWQVLRLSFIGFFFSNVIPGSVSGDAVKAYYVARQYGKTTQAITSVLVDRFIGLYTFVLTACVAIGVCWWSGKSPDVFAVPGMVALCWSVIGLAAGMTAFAAAVLSRRAKESGAFDQLLGRLPFQKQIRKLYDAIHLYRDKKGALAFVLALSAVAQAPMVLATFVLGKALGDGGLPLAAYFVVTPLGLVINSIPLLPGGVGTGEAAFEVLFRSFGSGVGFEVAMWWRVLFLGWSLIGMVFYVIGKKACDAAAPEASDAAIDAP